MRNIFRDIKHFIQRGRRGWADCDVWNFDDYLCDIIIAGIERLQKDQLGCPSDFWDESAKNDECHRWIECLEEMKQGFMAVKEQDEIHYSFKTDKNGERIIDLKRIDQLEKKMERGLSLFAKHFRALWD